VQTGLHAQAKNFNTMQGTYKTIFDMLREVPGVEVRPSNDKSGGTVTIRGLGRLQGGGNIPPLFVVDGVVFSGEITSINPQDVDMISVLKDASTTSVYGAQGAGGVISVTTKKGTLGSKSAVVASHEESAYSYFISHKTALKVFGMDDQVIIEGIVEKQRDSVLVFIKKRKEVLVPIARIKRVEMIPEQ
jgi:TonB-dependent SusC/RagA subfamily outer membrane receptor